MHEKTPGEATSASDQKRKSGAEKVPEDRLDEQGDSTLGPQVPDVDHCRECGKRLGAGYLCDDCDTVTFLDEDE